MQVLPPRPPPPPGWPEFRIPHRPPNATDTLTRRDCTQQIVPFLGPSGSAEDGRSCSQHVEPLHARKGSIKVMSVTVAVAIALCAALAALAVFHQKKKVERSRREERTAACVLYACALLSHCSPENCARLRDACHMHACIIRHRPCFCAAPGLPRDLGCRDMKSGWTSHAGPAPYGFCAGQKIQLS